jgi:hypothetical protein
MEHGLDESSPYGRLVSHVLDHEACREAMHLCVLLSPKNGGQRIEPW